MASRFAAPALAKALTHQAPGAGQDVVRRRRLWMPLLQVLLCIGLEFAVAIEQKRRGVENASGAALLALLMGCIPAGAVLTMAYRQGSAVAAVRAALLYAGWIACAVLLYEIR